ncbi:MAG: hypothetical protein HOQ05_10705 [Corynebacteriales bacterium]|nr:hypothetical protein [Mycobacteriales bacterium]
MFGPLPGVESGSEFVFPDWSPYTDLDEAARAYFRDPDMALEALRTALGGRQVLGFSLERVVTDDGMVWQEAVVCDGDRLIMWHGEDIPTEELAEAAPHGAMTSAIRTIPLKRVSEVGYRQVMARTESGELHLHGVDAYILLESVDEARIVEREGEQSTMFAHDSVRLGKSIEAGGTGQAQRLLEFAQLVAGLAGLPLH